MPVNSAPRILLVDDDPRITAGLSRILTLRGCVVCAVNVPTEAVPVALEFEPDLLVLDFRMPRLDGAQIALASARHPKLSRCEIVFCTASSEWEIAAELPAMAFQILPKPFDVRALLAIVEGLKQQKLPAA